MGIAFKEIKCDGYLLVLDTRELDSEISEFCSKFPTNRMFHRYLFETRIRSNRSKIYEVTRRESCKTRKRTAKLPRSTSPTPTRIFFQIYKRISYT